jgi:hypothetical protein
MKHVDPQTVVFTIHMDRNARLIHWARLIRAYRGPILMFHGLEYMGVNQLRATRPYEMATSIYSIAIDEPAFQNQGLSASSNMLEISEFFGLNQNHIHALSCDCNGLHSTTQVADLIERIAR